MDFLNALFPHNGAYDGLLSVDRVKALQRNSMLRAGLGVLGATTGPQPQATLPALAQNVGGAVAAFPGEVEQAAQGAARITNWQQEQDKIQKRQEILARVPQRPGEDPVEWIKRLYPEFLRASDMEVLAKLTEILKSAQNGNGGNDLREIDTGPGGKSILYNPRGETVREFQNVPNPNGPTGRGALKVIPGVNGPEYAVWDPTTRAFTPTGQPATMTEAQQRVNALSSMVQDAQQFLETSLAPNRIQEMVANRGLNEFLRDNAEELEQTSSIIADAYVRLTSGAAAREEEYTRARKMITPHAGDGDAVLARKNRARNTLLRALRRGGGIMEPSGTAAAKKPLGEY